MRIADANTILRFLLKDNHEQFAEAEKVFDSNEEIFVPAEIIAETVLDYADCIVFSYAQSKGSDIFSFDKGLISFFKRNRK